MNIFDRDIEELARNSQLFSPFEGKTILITGATGLLGSILIKSILKYNKNAKNKIQIIGIARNKQKINSIFNNLLDHIPELKIYVQDITTPLVIDSSIDYIIHTASITSSQSFIKFPVETIQTTILGCKNILSLARKKNVTGIVYLSSLEVYGFPFESDSISYYDEDSYGFLNPCLVRSSYPESKRLAECLCVSYFTEYNVPVKIVRLAQTFGPGVLYNDSRVFAEFARCAIEKKDIVLYSSGNTIRNYCYTTDAVSAILMVLHKGIHGEAYNIANKNTTASIREIAEMVCSLTNNIIHIKYKNPKAVLGYNPEMKVVLLTKKIEDLGWNPKYDLREMFIRLISSLTI